MSLQLCAPKLYQPRNRRNFIGELIQIDGSDHRWFEERGPACTLLMYIDDAASLHSIIELGHALEIHVVVEGVERPGQVDYLRQENCKDLKDF